MTEFALAIILLVGAGLLIRSLWSRGERRSGIQARAGPFDRSSPLRPSWQPRNGPTFTAACSNRLRSLPGVESAGITSDLFIGGNPERIVTAEGDSSKLSPSACGSEATRSARDSSRPRRLLYSGGASFRPRTGLILRGSRSSTMRWLAACGPGAIRWARDSNSASADSASPWFTVVGVVGDMRRQGLENEPIPQMFEPLAQNPSRRATLLVRTSMDDPLKMVGAVQAAVRRVEKHAPLYRRDDLGKSALELSHPAPLPDLAPVGFSVVALLMAAIGIYGLIQYSVATRTQEIGIRMAVGAQAGEIFRMIIGEGLKLSLTGLVLGLVGALWLGQPARVSCSALPPPIR